MLVDSVFSCWQPSELASAVSFVSLSTTLYLCLSGFWGSLLTPSLPTLRAREAFLRGMVRGTDREAGGGEVEGILGFE